MSFLKKLFGPSQREVWQQLATEINANYVKDSVWTGAKVQATVNEWTVTLDTFVITTGKTVIPFTRMRAPYINKDNFRFKIYRKSMFSGIAKYFGMQDIEVGYPEFDEHFIIQGTDEDKLRQLFANAKIRELLEAQPEISLEVKDDEGWFGTKFPEGVDELYFHVGGVIREVDRLKQLYDLFAEVLNELCHIGSAYEDNPNVQVK